MPNGTQVFAEDHFCWDSETKPYKHVSIAGVDNIHRENWRCANMDGR
jgi:hypothetical protein